jgi:hypothetical protein
MSWGGCNVIVPVGRYHQQCCKQGKVFSGYFIYILTNVMIEV